MEKKFTKIPNLIPVSKWWRKNPSIEWVYYCYQNASEYEISHFFFLVNGQLHVDEEAILNWNITTRRK